MNNNMNDESSEQKRKTEKEKSINSSSDSSSNDSNNNAEASTEIFHQHLTVEENDINTVNDDTEIASESPSRASVGAPTTAPWVYLLAPIMSWGQDLAIPLLVMIQVQSKS